MSTKVMADAEQLSEHLRRATAPRAGEPAGWSEAVRRALEAYLSAREILGEREVDVSDVEEGLDLASLWRLWSQTGAREEGRALGEYLRWLGGDGPFTPFDVGSEMQDRHWMARSKITAALMLAGVYIDQCQTRGADPGPASGWPLALRDAARVAEARAQRGELERAVGAAPARGPTPRV